MRDRLKFNSTSMRGVQTSHGNMTPATPIPRSLKKWVSSTGLAVTVDLLAEPSKVYFSWLAQTVFKNSNCKMGKAGHNCGRERKKDNARLDKDELNALLIRQLTEALNKKTRSEVGHAGEIKIANSYSFRKTDFKGRKTEVPPVDFFIGGWHKGSIWQPYAIQLCGNLIVLLIFVQVCDER